ncbi:unnamed protein product [Sympodiomycopsis kandeliae]
MQSTTDLDVAVVGAGISGINAAYRLQTETKLSFEILEARNDLGGTWSMFQYPGLRSDSDMHTLGFPFRPWSKKQSIAEGDDIYQYIKETAEEFGIDKKITYNSQVRGADWSSSERKWTLKIFNVETDQERTLTAKFVIFCSGYYDYKKGYQPHIAGMDGYKGKWIHPQAWPTDYDYTGKKMVVIGSGATAVTLLPNLAKKAKHVTLLQRSPSYFVALDNSAGGSYAKTILSYILPQTIFFGLLRFALAMRSYVFYWVCQAFPKIARYVLRRLTKQQLPSRVSIDPHFSPSYNPWDQRVCIVPDGDMFRALREGNADIATGKIDTITPNGIRLTDGQELEADAIVCATGLNLKLFGGSQLSIDGQVVDTSQRFIFRGQMISGLPNASMAFGYVNASWTLGSDVCVLYVTRLLNWMQRNNVSHVTPRPPKNFDIQDSEPLAALNSGYFQRALDVLPRSAGKGPWRMNSNWFFDFLRARFGSLTQDLDVSYASVKSKSA